MITTLKHYWLGLVLTVALLAAASGVAFQSSAIGGWFIETSRQAGFVLNRLDVTGYSRTDYNDILSVLEIDNGMPLLGIDLVSLQERIETLPWVKRAQITRQLPSNLKIEIIERQPYALWQYNGKIRLIDNSGHVITGSRLSEFADLLMIVGETAPEDLPNLLTILSYEPALASNIQSVVRVSKRRWDLVFTSGIRVKLPEDNAAAYDSADAWKKFISLQAKHNTLGREVSVIDMRIPDRVIMRVTPSGRRMMEGREWIT